jgi:hypothetical protein
MTRLTIFQSIFGGQTIMIFIMIEFSEILGGEGGSLRLVKRG